ncbi:MAG: SoxR reducing system RseC family protein [Immundisolibacteraceae bacterium]|nr:SoxR reducing system RseC family protein [Immundisolibacteraceae bacterium]
MIEVTARVERADEQFVWLMRNIDSNCLRCRQGNGCSGAIWGKLLSSRQLLKLPNRVNAAAGNRLRLSIKESHLLRTSLLAYLLPLIWLIATAGSGHYWYGDAGAILAALIGTIVWLIGFRRLVASQSAGRVFQNMAQTLMADRD